MARSDIKIKFNSGAFYKLRSDPGVKKALEDLAEDVAAKANRASKSDGYKTSSRQGARRPQGRWRTTVITANAEAMRDQVKNNTLIKALFGSG